MFFFVFFETPRLRSKKKKRIRSQTELFEKYKGALKKRAGEVATNLAVVWTADETWTRSLLAGEVKSPPLRAPHPETRREKRDPAQ